MHNAVKLPLINKFNVENQIKMTTLNLQDQQYNSQSAERQKNHYENEANIFQRRRNTTTHENLPKPQKEIFIQDQFRYQTETNQPKLKLKQENLRDTIIKRNANKGKQIFSEESTPQNNGKNENEKNSIDKKYHRQIHSLQSERTKTQESKNSLLVHFGFKEKWTKKLKSVFLAARALFRLILLVKPKRQKWDEQISKETAFLEELKLQTVIHGIKIKQWCQMVFTKLFSIINSKDLYFINLNFIENQLSPLELDTAITVNTKVIWYFMTSIQFFTTQKYFMRELGLIMYKDQFSNQRKYFNKFVTSRTNYLSEQNRIISDQEKVMIFAESVLFNNLILSLMMQSISEKLDITRPSTLFLIKIILSLMQFLFQDTFKKLPQINTKSFHKNFTQIQFSISNGNQINLQQIVQKDSDLLIIGTYKSEDLKPLFAKKNWNSSIRTIFKRILLNLHEYKL